MLRPLARKFICLSAEPRRRATAIGKRERRCSTSFRNGSRFTSITAANCNARRSIIRSRVSVTASENSGAIASELAEVGRSCYARGWVLGTSGNFSAVLNGNLLHVAITASVVEKGAIPAAQNLMIDEHAKALSNNQSKPSDETPLHLMLIGKLGAGAVLHTHSVWSTMLSDIHAAEK